MKTVKPEQLGLTLKTAAEDMSDNIGFLGFGKVWEIRTMENVKL